MAATNPLNEKLVVIAGGSGFLGNYVAQALLERGARVRIASRNPKQAFHLKPLANLGQIQFARFDISDERSVAAVVQGADAVVNLIGSFDGNLSELMGTDAGQLAVAAKAAGAGAFVQVSAIGADAASASEYARAKALGEKLVLEAFPKASVLRPSMIFGKEDNFINMFAGLIQMMPVLPVFGPESKIQPLHAGDCAEAIAAALSDPAKYGGKVYELGGPEQITMMELNHRIAAAQGRNRTFLPMPDAASGVFAALPLTPMNSDQWAMLKQGNVVSDKAPGFKQFGIEPKPLGLFLDRWMVQYRKHGRFSTAAKA